MKLLINICAHDGIISYYTGVGTMVNRYIDAFSEILEEMNNSYEINLFTPEYTKKSFGYNKNIMLKNSKYKINEIYNGSNGKINFGTIENWKLLSKNTAKLINNIDYSKYDLVLTIYNDTPFACLPRYLNNHKNHLKIWIPHSTIKIHEEDSAVHNSIETYNERLEWENEAIKYINKNKNSYLGSICEYMELHLIEEYKLKKEKVINIYNGELLDESKIIFSKESLELLDNIKNYDRIILSFSRAEKYKNLEATMHLGRELKIPTIVIAQSYHDKQPILEEYKNIAEQNGTYLYISPPFDFAKCILNNYKKNIIVVIPSKKEVMGLIINEVRKINRDNILIVANNVGGLKYQIEDTVNGLLIDVDDIKSSASKIKKYYSARVMKKMNLNSQFILRNKYNFRKNAFQFIKCLMENI